MTPYARTERYKNHRFPGEIISHGVWLYYRFTLIYRDVQELLFERGIAVTYEAIRQWCRKFGQDYANQLRRRRPRPGDKWHLDEVFLTINGKRHYLWRAVDQDDNVLDILVQVRFVDQKPNLEKVWGIGPELKSSDAPKPENWVPVSVKFRPLLVRG
jgi:putative transposase